MSVAHGIEFPISCDAPRGEYQEMEFKDIGVFDGCDYAGAQCFIYCPNHFLKLLLMLNSNLNM